MSRKNNRSIKAKKHAHDIELEKKAAEEAKKRQEKRAEKNKDPNKVLKVKRKPIKLRKNMRIRGIKVKDSDSKKKVLRILRRERAEKEMDVDKPTLIKKKLKKKKVVTVTTAPAAAATPSGDAMEM